MAKLRESMRLFVVLDKPVPETMHRRTRRPALADGPTAFGTPELTSSPRPNTRLMSVVPRETAVFDMSESGTRRALRQRKRVRQRKIGAALAIVGLLVWVSFVVLQFATEDLLSDNLLYLGITVGGATVVAGIILIATTL